jgi:pilus assembly protein Flp/PilA
MRKGIIMRMLGRYLTNLLRDDDGPTAVEYAVMLALIIVVSIVAITNLGTAVNNTMTNVGSALTGS